MEPLEHGGDSRSDRFSDALDAFPPSNPGEPIVSTSNPTPEPVGNRPDEEIAPSRHPMATSPTSLRRRRPYSKSAASRRSAATDSNDPSCNSFTVSPSPIPRERRSEILHAPQADASSSTLSSDQISIGRDQNLESSRRSAATIEFHAVEPQADDAGSPPQSLLVSVAGFLIKAIFFQMNLLISSFTFPIWLLHRSFLLVTDPFGTLRSGRDCLRERILWVLKLLMKRVSPLVKESLGSQQGAWKLMERLGWGCFWSFYVCFVLLGLLAAAFLAGSLLMGWVVEEPVRITEDLNFDYTKASPDALVPLLPCDGGGCGLDCRDKVGVERHTGWRPVPPNHKLQLTISLTLPESDYNRKLGVFQVRAEFLAANGKVTSSSSQPCMLRFKSHHIRFIESFLKTGTLLAGYASESQILRLKMTGFTEGIEPTICTRVILEQRAEYRPGAGIPEIYVASLKLESALPLFKRIMWNWRKTVFIWISMSLFIWELLIVLVCCRPVIVPRARASVGPPSRI